MTDYFYSKKILLITIILFSLCLFNITSAERETGIKVKKALHLDTIDPDEYAYISRNIPEIQVNNSVIEFKAAIKIIKVQAITLGIPLQIDLRGHSNSSKTQELRYSFRIGNDGSVSFFYPFLDSSAAITRKNVLTFGKWHSLSIFVNNISAKCYIDGILVAENDIDHPANSNNYAISHIGLGKTERQKVNVNAFVTNIQLIENNTFKILEDFTNDLDAYVIKKSEKTLLDIIDPSKYTTFEIYVNPSVAFGGDIINIHAKLLDSSLTGIANKTVKFEYATNNEWIQIASSKTLSNGTVSSSWRIPENLPRILIRVYFSGDTQFSGTSSVPINILVTPKISKGFDTFNFVMPIYSIVLLGISILAFRSGYVKVLQNMIPILCSLILFFNLPFFTNSIEIETFIGYTQKTVKLEFFGSDVDKLILLLSLITLIASWIILNNKKLINNIQKLIVIFSLAFSLILHLIGIEFLGTLGIFSGLAIMIFPILVEKNTNNNARFLIIFFTTLLSIVFVIEIGAIIGWISNIADPHVPFDNEPRWTLTSLEVNMFGLLYPTTLIALIILMFAWLWVPFLRVLIKPEQSSINKKNDMPYHEKISVINYFQQDNSIYPISQSKKFSANIKLNHLWLFTIPLIIGCALFLVYYPYFYSSRLIGVDTPWYYQNLIATSYLGGLDYLITNYGTATRMQYLLILFIIKSITAFPPDLVVKIGPAVPATFMGLTTLFLVKTITCNNRVAFFSSFLGLFSIATTVGVYAGIFANWLALGWATLFLTLLLRSWEKSSHLRILMSILVSFLILITHTWTWAVILGALGVFTLLRLLSVRSKVIISNEPTIITNTIIIFANLILLSAILILFYQGEFVNLSREVISGINLENLKNFPTIFSFTVQYYVGGFFANPILILLSIFGISITYKFNEKLSLFLLSILLVISIPLILVSSLWQWRLIYMIPYQILAILGIDKITQKIIGSDGFMAKACRDLFMTTIILSCFNYALRSLNYIPS